MHLCVALARTEIYQCRRSPPARSPRSAGAPSKTRCRAGAVGAWGSARCCAVCPVTRRPPVSWSISSGGARRGRGALCAPGARNRHT